MLAAAVFLVLVVPEIPLIHWIGRPLGWLGTLVHEAGHAIGMSTVGEGCKGIEVFLNGSGVAWSKGSGAGPLRAITSVAGLVGPAVISALLLWSSVSPRLARVAFGLLGLGLFGLAISLTQGFATLIAVGWGAVMLIAAWKLSGEPARMVLLALGVQLALQVYRGRGYLFAAEAHTSAGAMPSDVANIATALGGHYLFWGVCVGALDVLLLAAGLAGFFVGDRVLARFLAWRRARSS